MASRTIPRPSGSLDWARQPFFVLAAFLVLVFLTGGSSWAHENQLIYLRPAAILVAAWGLAQLNREDWSGHKVIWWLFGSTVMLTVLHLVPLPYSWWSSLPGRSVLVQIDALVGFGAIARPLSMQPEATANALFSLAVPLAVLTLGVRLDENEHRRLAGALMALIAMSLLVGLVQLSGSLFALYEPVSSIDPSGLFNNRNHQGAALAMLVPLGFLAWRGGFRSGMSIRIERGLASALTVIAIPLVVVTGSRAGLVLTAIALLFVFTEVSLRTIAQRSKRYASTRLIAGLLAVALLVWFTILAGRSAAISRLLGSDEELRYPVWQSIIEVVPAYWPWGSGIGSYPDVYPILEPDGLLRPTFSNHAHNEWLEIAFTSGAAGLVILTAAVAAFIAGAIRAWRLGPGAGDLPRAGVLVILLLAIASSTDYPVRTPIMMAILSIAALWVSRGRAGASASRNSTRANG